MKKFLKIDGGESCTTMWLYLLPMNWTLPLNLKLVKMIHLGHIYFIIIIFWILISFRIKSQFISIIHIFFMLWSPAHSSGLSFVTWPRPQCLMLCPVKPSSAFIAFSGKFSMTHTHTPKTQEVEILPETQWVPTAPDWPFSWELWLYTVRIWVVDPWSNACISHCLFSY